MASRFLSRSLCFLLLSTNVFAAPSNYLKERGDNTAGLGIEIEWRNCEMLNNAKGLDIPDVTSKMVDDIKGTTVIISDISSALNDKPDWGMTAEHQGSEDKIGITRIIPEFIVNGLKVKVGAGRVEKIGTEIVDFLRTWSPSVAHNSAVVVPGFAVYGPWKVVKPSTFNDANIQFLDLGMQVTAPMSLAGIHSLFEKAKTSVGNPLITGFVPRINNMHLVEAKHVDSSFKKNPLTNLSPDSLGFLSLVVTYAKASAKVKPDEGIKHTSPIMPRTDFATMYSKFVEADLKKVLATDGCTYSLYNLVKSLAEYKGDGTDKKDTTFSAKAFDTAEIKWKNDLATPPKSTTLKIEKWMNGLENSNFDLMKESDKTIDGQVGGLGDRLETLYNSPSISAPIFEFRDLIVRGGTLPGQLKAVEDALIQSHTDFNQAPARALARQAGAKPKETAKACSRTTSAKPSATAKSCPEGKKASKDGKDCVDKPSPESKGQCPDGKILDPAEGGQTKDTPKPVCMDEPDCRDDEVASTPLYKPSGRGPSNCVKKPAKDKKCEASQWAQVTSDGDAVAIVECVDTRKTVEEKKTAEQKKQAEEDKKKEEEEKKKKKAAEEEEKKKQKEFKEKTDKRGRFCMTLLATSEFLPEGEIPGVDDIEDAISDLWPKDWKTVSGYEFTDSNIEKGHKPDPATKVALSGDIEVAAAGFNPAVLINAFKNLFRGGQSAAKSFAQAGVEVAAKTAAQTAKFALKPGRIGEKAGNSIKKIKDNPNLMDCLAALPFWIEASNFRVGEEIPQKGFPVQSNHGYVHFWKDEDGGAGVFSDPAAPAYRMSYEDAFYHEDRLEDGKCYGMPDGFNDAVSAFDVANTCCSFYRDSGCVNHMFSAFNREDGDLPGDHNDNISSYMCTWDGCNGRHPEVAMDDRN